MIHERDDDAKGKLVFLETVMTLSSSTTVLEK